MRPEEVSTAKIFADQHEELVSWQRVLGAEEWLGCLPVAVTAEQVVGRLRALLGRAWSRRWRKAADPKPQRHPPKAKQSGAHTSVHKILQQAKQQPTNPPPRQNE
jgi:hypothetical protein